MLPIPAFPNQGKENKSHPCERDSGSNLDYSGGRKTHRFPPPYGLGSLSLTHRPTENPTGVTPIFFCHSELDSVSHSWANCKGGFYSLPYSGRARVGSGQFLCHSGLRPGIALLNRLQGAKHVY